MRHFGVVVPAASLALSLLLAACAAATPTPTLAPTLQPFPAGVLQPPIFKLRLVDPNHVLIALGAVEEKMSHQAACSSAATGKSINSLT